MSRRRELLPLWGFKNIETAKKSADPIYERFLDYKAEHDGYLRLKKEHCESVEPRGDASQTIG